MTASHNDLFSVAGRTYLVTGATGAFGAMAARALVEGGANVVLAGGNSDKLNQLAHEFGAERVRTVAKRPDNDADVQAMVDAAVQEFGELNGVVIASGTNKPNMIDDMPVEDYDMVMDANVRGAWLICKYAGRQMQQQGKGGTIAMVSSVRGLRGHPGGYSVYSASKGATNALARNQAVEWGKDQIRVNTIAPCVFRSDVTGWMYDENNEHGLKVRAGMEAHIPMGRLAEPEDFKGTVLYLMSDASGFTTAQTIGVDGGYLAW